MEGYGLRVLVAENDEDTRSALTDVLMKVGYNVFAVADDIAAIEELKKRHFDVVLTDYQMPRLNGLELLALSHELVPETPVIVISGNHPSIEQIAMERGAFAWIRNPAPLTQVLIILREALAQARSAESAIETESESSLPLAVSTDLVAQGQ